METDRRICIYDSKCYNYGPHSRNKQKAKASHQLIHWQLVRYNRKPQSGGHKRTGKKHLVCNAIQRRTEIQEMELAVGKHRTQNI